MELEGSEHLNHLINTGGLGIAVLGMWLLSYIESSMFRIQVVLAKLMKY